MSDNQVKLQLFITPQYEVSPFLRNASPEDTEYILDYGENLLREHQMLANKEILNERLAGLTKTLQDKALEAQGLASQLKIAQQSAQQEAQSIVIQYSKQVDALKQEIQTIKNQSGLDLNEQLKSQLHQQSQQYNVKLQQFMIDNEKDIQTLRNKYLNDAQLDTSRLNQQLTDQIKQNDILQNKLEHERDQIYTLTDKIRKDVMTELYERNSLEKELIKNEIKDS